MSQKIRSTSHFWSKLHELSMPVLNNGNISRCSSNDNGGGNSLNSNSTESVAAISSALSMSSTTATTFIYQTESSLSPIDIETTKKRNGGTTADGKEAINVNMSQQSNNSLSSNSSTNTAATTTVTSATTVARRPSTTASMRLSRSQLERGKLLELFLSVLGCSAQWYLHLLADR